MSVAVGALAAPSLGAVGFGTLGPALQAEFHFSRTDLGLLTALVFAGASFTSKIAGVLTDSEGPSTVLGGSLLIVALGFSIVAIAPSAPVIMAAAFVAGVGFGGVGAPTNVLIAKGATRRLGLLMSLKQTGVPLGGALSGLILPPLAIALSWRWAFAFVVIVVLSAAVLARQLRNAVVHSGSTNFAQGMSPPIRERVAISMYCFVMVGMQWVFLTYFVLYLVRSRDFSLAHAGLLLTVATASSVAGRLLWGWLSDRSRSRRKVLVIAAAIAATSLALLAVDVPVAALWFLAALTGLALVGWQGVFHAFVADRAGPGATGRLSGEVMTFGFVGSVVLPPLAGFISEQMDSWSLLWALASGAVLAAALLLHAGVVREPLLQDTDSVH
jgi:MFS family permease